MTSYPRLIQLGTIDSGATAIQVDATFYDGNVSSVSVILNTAYNRAPPVDWPQAPGAVGQSTVGMASYLGVIASDTTLLLHTLEAAALVAAGAAAYA